MSTVGPSTAARSALDLIKRAMRLVGVNSLGEEPSDDEASNGLIALNGMLGLWSNSSLLIPVETIDAIPIVANTSVYTIGASGTFVSDRPMQAVDSSYVVYNSISYRCPLLTTAKYDSISYKPLTAEFPRFIWYQPDYPDGTLTVYPTPTAISTLNFVSLKPLASFSGLTTAASLPPGYEEAIAFNLAVSFGQEFDGASIPAWVIQQAANTKRALKRTNTRVPGLTLPSAVTTSSARGRIIDGP